ncbi:hypothetical protein BCR43DRAFT_210416 [Syncephalastrum racemosum]|uniref:Uncharacterized protein n=1 Tax=Syncephalastrum racemosum TaxID=13706 RepID=A0A1X2HIH4_SYNRA|nr:hypothetical protein BCR43DRAFT_210416 [Syncephalastrum racemosum]
MSLSCRTYYILHIFFFGLNGTQAIITRIRVRQTGHLLWIHSWVSVSPIGRERHSSNAFKLPKSSHIKDEEYDHTGIHDRCR